MGDVLTRVRSWCGRCANKSEELVWEMSGWGIGVDMLLSILRDGTSLPFSTVDTICIVSPLARFDLIPPSIPPIPSIPSIDLGNSRFGWVSPFFSGQWGKGQGVRMGVSLGK